MKVNCFVRADLSEIDSLLLSLQITMAIVVKKAWATKTYSRLIN